MPRKTAEQRKAEEQAARPFADASTAPFAGRSEEERRSIAEAIAADKAQGLSGNELRAKYGERLTGPARRKVLRAFGLDSPATIARSYDAYRDGEPRSGSRHAREHGAQAEARKAEAREQAEAELQAARKARKGRSKADREAYAARVAQAEARVASLA
jgi:hypothetical protein